MEYMLLIYHNEEEATQRPDADKQQIFQEFAGVHAGHHEERQAQGWGPARVHPHGRDGSRARRQDDGHGRAVRGDQGAARRIRT